jgi:flavin reductase (DIM6/NTAB) family NADH-FMN oxidoreductase RutF
VRASVTTDELNSPSSALIRYGMHSPFDAIGAGMIQRPSVGPVDGSPGQSPSAEMVRPGHRFPGLPQGPVERRKHSGDGHVAVSGLEPIPFSYPRPSPEFTLRTTAELHDRTDAGELRRVYGCFPSGIAAVCALDGTRVPTGMAVSSFTSVSLEPPLVSVCVQNSSTTWPVLQQAARLGVSVLAEGQEGAARALAAKGIDRFAELSWTATDGGAVLLHDAAAWLDCEIDAMHPAGDHIVVLLRVRALVGDPAHRPLVFHASKFRGLLAEAGELSQAG